MFLRQGKCEDYSVTLCVYIPGCAIVEGECDDASELKIPTGSTAGRQNERPLQASCKGLLAAQCWLTSGCIFVVTKTTDFNKNAHFGCVATFLEQVRFFRR